MDIKVSVNIEQGGITKFVNYTIGNKKVGYQDINFKMNPTLNTMRVINLNDDAYEYMVSSECPEWEKKGDWLRMSKKARLKSHLNRLAEHFDGKLSDYQVFDD